MKRFLPTVKVVLQLMAYVTFSAAFILVPNTYNDWVALERNTADLILRLLWHNGMLIPAGVGFIYLASFIPDDKD